MASDKDSMLRTANRYAEKISAAAQHCEAAATAMIDPQSNIRANWGGASGEAMNQALDELHFELNKIYAQLVSIESQMRSRAQNIYANWPEETAGGGGGGAFGGGGGGSRGGEAGGR